MQQNDTMIRVRGVKKQYRLGQIGGGTLRGDLQSWWARKRGKEDPNTIIGTDQRLVGTTFMALNGVLDILDCIILIAAGGFLTVFFYSVSIILALASAITGFILYRKIMAYLAGSYMAPAYKNLLGWTIAFVIICVLYSLTVVGLSIESLVMDPASLYGWAAFVSVLPNIAFPLAILFTTMRLAH